MKPERIGETEVGQCSRCDGVWVSRETFRHVRMDIDRQSEIAALLGAEPRFVEEKVVYLRCAECEGPMARINFGRRSGVIVDQCPTHGIWFDPGELGAAIEFLIAHGGKLDPTPVAEAPAREPPRSMAAWPERGRLVRPSALLEAAVDAIFGFLWRA